MHQKSLVQPILHLGPILAKVVEQGIEVQKKTPDENLGKVMAIITAVSQCAAPVGQIIYGLAFQGFSEAVYKPTLLVSIAMLIMAGGAQRILKKEKSD